MTSVYDFSVIDIDGAVVPLSIYTGKVLLIVNTASRCGFTSQYSALETLHKELSPRGFSVLAFPCNQFGAQEPGDEAEIKKFCALTYATSFPLFKKVDVNGEQQAPLYAYLKQAAPGILGTEAIKWNFTKFLIDRQGQVRARFAPSYAPLSIKAQIEALL